MLKTLNFGGDPFKHRQFNRVDITSFRAMLKVNPITVRPASTDLITVMI